MKHCLKAVCTLVVAAAIFTVVPGHADEDQTMIVSIETDSFDLTEMDIGSLAIGESKTIETDSGQVIDLLRTVDDIEIYIDGELLDIGFGHDPESQIHVIRKQVEVLCDDEDESACEKHLVINAGGDHDHSIWSAGGDGNVFVHDEIEITCIDPEDDSDCAEHVLRLTGDGEIEIESLHEAQVDGEGRKFIVITSKADSSN